MDVRRDDGFRCGEDVEETFEDVEEGCGCDCDGEGSGFDEDAEAEAVPDVREEVVVADAEDEDDVGEDRGARINNAANAIQPVYAKLTIVLMSDRSYLHTTK